ncbi:MAG TPA: DUF2177 family protein [Chitinophagales bacterium]|nr:DUF2177 family protein [Chitinophagales bacterium]HRK25794.1 DUF2177 family protein [Chitinophagales bacterium]
MQYLLTYLVTTVLFFAIDMVWLGVIAKNFYRQHLGHLMAEQVNWFAAIVFYLLYIGGILYFAVIPALQNGSGWQTAALNGAVLGLLCYATYDLTNLATLKGFPPLVVGIDIVWGTVLTGAVAGLGCLVSQRFW